MSETCCALICAGLNHELGISNEFFVLGDSVILTVLGQVSFMPVSILSLTCQTEHRVCPHLTWLCAGLFTSVRRARDDLRDACACIPADPGAGSPPVP